MKKIIIPILLLVIYFIKADEIEILKKNNITVQELNNTLYIQIDETENGKLSAGINFMLSIIENEYTNYSIIFQYPLGQIIIDNDIIKMYYSLSIKDRPLLILDLVKRYQKLYQEGDK